MGIFGEDFTGTFDASPAQAAAAAPVLDEDKRRQRGDFQIAGLDRLQAQNDARRFGYQHTAAQSLAQSLAARQAAQQNAQALGARAMGLGPSPIAAESAQGVAMAGQQASALAASGAGGNPMLAQRLAMRKAAGTVDDVGAKASGAQLRETSEAESGLGRALAAQRGADLSEYGQSGDAANAYYGAERQVAIQDAEMRARYQQALLQARLAQMGQATQQAGFAADLAQRQREADRSFAGSLIDAGGSGIGFAASNWPKTDSSKGGLSYDSSSGIYRGNPYG